MNPTSISRRRLLQAMAAAPVAASLPSLAVDEKPNRLLVLVFLYGGNDSYNTWVPYANDVYREVRPTIAIPRDAVLKVTDSHGFHPSLAPIMPMWDAKEIAIVQGIGYAEGTQQHYRDGETAFTGCDGTEYSVEGWVTRAIGKRARTGGEDAIAFNVLDVQAADPMGPFRGGSLGCVQVYYAQDLLASRHMDQCVFEANARGRAHLAAYPGALPAVPLKTDFPTDQFGQAMRATVELASIDRKLPVIHVALNGLDEDKHHSVDCHWDQLKYHGDALSRLAKGLAALREGLKEIGRWDETLVATYDEFGRCPTENEDHGTHHGLASVHFVMGGRVKGGLIGEAPRVRYMFPHIGGPAPTIDTRQLWTTVAQQWWNADSPNLFSKRHKPLDLLRA